MSRTSVEVAVHLGLQRKGRAQRHVAGGVNDAFVGNVFEAGDIEFVRSPDHFDARNPVLAGQRAVGIQHHVKPLDRRAVGLVERLDRDLTVRRTDDLDRKGKLAGGMW